MKCKECGEGEMESMGYGDEMCNECGYTEYAESEEDFENRISKNSADDGEPAH